MKRDYTSLDNAIVEDARAGGGYPNWSLDVIRAACEIAGLALDPNRTTIQELADHDIDPMISRRTRAVSKAGRIRYDRRRRRYEAVA